MSRYRTLNKILSELEEINSSVSSIESDIENALEPEEGLDVEQAKEEGWSHGLKQSLEVALAHAQQTFGFHAKETHFIEDLISQL